MAVNSGISWTQSTFNAIRGCTKVSPACKFCYADRLSKQNPAVLGVWGDQGTRVLASEAMWNVPLKWNQWSKHDATTINNIDVGVQRLGRVSRELFLSGASREISRSLERCIERGFIVDDGVLLTVGRPFERTRVFCASLSDVFEDWDGPIVDSQGREVWFSTDEPDRMIAMRPDLLPFERENVDAGYYRAVTMADVRDRLFRLIDGTPNLDWLLLTKRPENILKMWPTRSLHWDPRAPLPSVPYPNADDPTCPRQAYYRKNVWIGCSVENQEYANKRIPELLKCRDLSPVLFLSCEPLLGEVRLNQIERFVKGREPDGSDDITFYDNCLTGLKAHKGGGWIGPNVDFVIAGGESGSDKGVRPSHPAWFRSLRDQCKTAGIPFHFKQWGEWGISKSFDGGEMADARVDTCGRDVKELHGLHSDTDVFMDRDGVKNTGRILDGILHDEFPKVSR